MESPTPVQFMVAFALRFSAPVTKTMSAPEITCQSFDELSNSDLYDMLKLRSAVFVVEQDCVFPDMDDYDQQAQHILLKVDDRLVAYARLLAAGTKYQGGPSIGRVVTDESVRRDGYGRILMSAAVARCRELWPGETVIISAQQYLENFYCSFGFTTVSEPYLEDGIYHLEMHLEGSPDS